jgi:hypothetical protein
LRETLAELPIGDQIGLLRRNHAARKVPWYSSTSLLREQHRPQFLAYLFEKLGADPRAFAAADDLDPLDPDACCQFS